MSNTNEELTEKEKQSVATKKRLAQVGEELVTGCTEEGNEIIGAATVILTNDGVSHRMFMNKKATEASPLSSANASIALFESAHKSLVNGVQDAWNNIASFGDSHPELRGSLATIYRHVLEPFVDKHMEAIDKIEKRTDPHRLSEQALLTQLMEEEL